MQCSNCGAPIEQEGARCTHCGPTSAPKTRTVTLTPAFVTANDIKTKTDKVCGVVFLAFAVAGIIFSVWQLGQTLDSFTTVFTQFDFYTSFVAIFSEDAVPNLPLALGAFGNTCVALAAILSAIAGVLALVRGHGRKPAYAATVFILFALLFHVTATITAFLRGELAFDALSSALFAALPLYIFDALFAFAGMILIPFKRVAKQKAMQAATSPLTATASVDAS